MGSSLDASSARASAQVDTLSAPVRDTIAADWLLAQDRQNTRDAYRRDIRAYFAWCDEFGIDVLTATPRMLRGYRRFLEDGSTGRAYKQATVHRKLTAVSSYYTFAMQQDDDLVTANPLDQVKRPKVGKESTTIGLDRDELKRLLAVADATGTWEAAFVRMLFYTGCRVSELCGARTSDLRTERGHRVLWVERKGGEPLKLAVALPAAAALDAHLAGRTGALFLDKRGQPLGRRVASYRLERLVARAGIKKRITPHSLRHTAATLALDAGQDVRRVMRMLGHKQMETTLRYDRARASVDHSPTHALADYVEDGG